MIIDDNFELMFNFKAAGVCQTFKVGDLPKESIMALLAYGTRKGNDAVNSAASVNPEKNRVELVDEWLDKLVKGELGQTSRAANEDAAFKAFIVNVLKVNGASAKSLKGLKASELIALIAKKAGKTSEEVEAALKAKYEAQKEALKAAMECLNI